MGRIIVEQLVPSHSREDQSDYSSPLRGFNIVTPASIGDPPSQRRVSDIRPEQHSTTCPINCATTPRGIRELQIYDHDQTESDYVGASEQMKNKCSVHNDFKSTPESLSKSNFTNGKEAISTKPILGEGCPEIFSFAGRNGEMCLGLSLTRSMVYRWNKIFQGESKIERYKCNINELERDELEVEGFINDIGKRLDHSAKATSIGTSQVLQELKHAEHSIFKAGIEKRLLEMKLQRTQADMEISRRQLARDWRELLAENNLLEPILASDNGSCTNHGAMVQRVRRHITLTASEIAQNAVTQAQDEAVKDIRLKEQRLQNAQGKIDNWREYYDEEYRKYSQRVADSIIQPARTTFDITLLKEQQEATGALIEAERAVEESRQHARRLGVVLRGTDQESGFASDDDDGYGGSTEADLIQQVDPAWIERWMNDKGETPHYATECDEWDLQTVDLCDSVSVVAEGKERTRIDSWRAICEGIDIHA